jgi:hypothetical protein
LITANKTTSLSTVPSELPSKIIVGGRRELNRHPYNTEATTQVERGKCNFFSRKTTLFAKDMGCQKKKKKKSFSHGCFIFPFFLQLPFSGDLAIDLFCDMSNT